MQGSHLPNCHIACGHPLTTELRVFAVVFAVLKVSTWLLRAHLKPFVNVTVTPGYKMNLPKDKKSKKFLFGFIFTAGRVARLRAMLSLKIFVHKGSDCRVLERSRGAASEHSGPMLQCPLLPRYLGGTETSRPSDTPVCSGENISSLREVRSVGAYGVRVCPHKLSRRWAETPNLSSCESEWAL